MHKFLFYNKFIICLYMFRALLWSSSGGQNCIIQHLVSSHSVGGRPVHRLREDSLSLCTGRPPTGVTYILCGGCIYSLCVDATVVLLAQYVLSLGVIICEIIVHLLVIAQNKKVLKLCYRYLLIIIIIIIISNLSNDRSKASSKTIPPHSAI